MAELRIAGTIGESIVDGPGIRYVLFTQGCPHGCPGCHNPQTHDFNGGKVVDTALLLADIRKNPFVKAVTFSGGEPFAQPLALAELASALKEQGYHSGPVRASHTVEIDGIYRLVGEEIHNFHDSSPMLLFKDLKVRSI